MFNAVNKQITIAISALSAIVGMTSCADSARKQRESEAAAIVEEAREAIDMKQYVKAIGLLDSLQSGYPDAVVSRREAMALRPLAIAGVTVREIEVNDSMLAMARWRVDSLRPLFRTENNPRLVEPYDEVSTVPSDLYAGGNTVVARLTPDGEFYMVSSVEGTGLHHTTLLLSAGGEEVSSGSVPYKADKSMTREIVHFNASRSDTLGRFAADHDNMSLTVRFVGEKKSAKAVLSPKDVHAIADTWRMSRARKEVVALTRRGEELAAKLQVARDQRARTAGGD